MARESGGSFYDSGDVHQRYTAHRDADPHLSPNHVMEEPAVLAELGDPVGLRILDLGCGDGQFERRLLEAGATSYRGVDSSMRMVEQAERTLAGTDGRVELMDIEDVRPQPGSLDLVTARLSLHYLAQLDHLMDVVAQSLSETGRFLFTVVHPVITGHDNQATGQRTHWTVDDYFSPGPRTRNWMGSEVAWYHRTIEDYVSAVTAAGMILTGLRECPPVPERFDGNTAELDRRRRVPLFLLLHATHRP